MGRGGGDLGKFTTQLLCRKKRKTEEKMGEERRNETDLGRLRGRRRRGTPLGAPLPHPTSARLLLKEPASPKPASGWGRPRLSPSRWRGGSRLVPCREPGPEACGKAIRNLGSVVTFRIWGVFTSNWSIVSLGERKVGRGQPGRRGAFCLRV